MSRHPWPQVAQQGQRAATGCTANRPLESAASRAVEGALPVLPGELKPPLPLGWRERPVLHEPTGGKRGPRPGPEHRSARHVAGKGRSGGSSAHVVGQTKQEPSLGRFQPTVRDERNLGSCPRSLLESLVPRIARFRHPGPDVAIACVVGVDPGEHFRAVPVEPLQVGAGLFVVGLGRVQDYALSIGHLDPDNIAGTQGTFVGCASHIIQAAGLSP